MFEYRPVSRRSFLRTTVVATTAGVLTSSTLQAKKVCGPNDQIRVAVCGLNNRGTSHILGFAPHVVALCDCDTEVLEQRAKQFEDKYGRKVDTFVDYRKLLERNDIDAIAIATPNHTHPLIGIAACQAGKHIYCEKPISHNIWEGRQLVNAVGKYNRIAQAGMQSRSSSGIREAVKWVQGGGLGAIRYALGTCYKPRKSIGRLNKPLVIPKSINYDLWCGPAAQVDLYRTKLHYDWHWDFNTGCGDMGNQGIHQMDIARWFLGHKTVSTRVISIGGRLGYEDAGDTPNTQVVLHDYPNAPIIFETRGLPKSKAVQKDWSHSMDCFRGSRIGVIVQCEDGYVVIPNYSSAVAFDKNNTVVKRWSGESQHYKNFIDAVRAGDRSLLNAPIIEGHISSSLCHTGNISHLLGEKLPAAEIANRVCGDDLVASSVDRMIYHLRMNEVDVDRPVVTLGSMLAMDPQTEQFIDSVAADKHLRRNDRKPFVIPEVDWKVVGTPPEAPSDISVKATPLAPPLH